MVPSLRFLASFLFGMSWLAVSVAADNSPDFNRDVRPILSDNCFQCHGPDEATREADLRLDTPETFRLATGSKKLVVPKNAAASELLRRLTTAKPEEVMPPPKLGKRLTEKQIDIIRRWIDSGANWRQHWSFQPPQSAELPNVSNSDWCRNGIDRFVLRKLDQLGWQPAPLADKSTLLRRVTLDLTGLPPTEDDIRSFESESSPNAYEKVVDRLLKSPRYAERMAIRWLEAARYADTSGYQSDGYRDMWRWRDWVLEAFDQNMPFDQFTIEQLAGDLLPNASESQRIATGFNRNHRGNSEGGIVPEEFQVEYVVDRVDTTMTVWQGLTFGCGRCHSHKYDPISQADYYRVFAFFNNIPEYGRAIKEGPSPPFMRAPTREQQHQLHELQSALATAQTKWSSTAKATIEALVTKWVEHSQLTADWSPSDALVVHLPFDGALKNVATIAEGETQRSATTVPTATERQTSLPTYEPRWVRRSDKSVQSADSKTPAQPVEPTAITRRSDRSPALDFDGDRFVDAGPIGKLGYFEQFSLAAWIKQDVRAAGSILSKMEHVAQGAGYSFDVTDQGRLQLNLVKRWLDDSLRIESTAAIPLGHWTHVCVTYDGSRLAKGIRVFVNGQQVAHQANLDLINQSFDVLEPLRIGSGQAAFRGQIDDVRIYRRQLADADVKVLSEDTTLAEIKQMPTARRSSSQQHKLRQAFLEAPRELHETKDEALGRERAAYQSQWQEVRTRQQAINAFERQLPTVMVMEESFPRQTHVLIRGAYDRPGEKVAPGVPTSLPPLPTDGKPDRLALAKWLVSEANPLTARVIVNRFWRDLFGIGLVKTTEDFGAQGEPPSHPELLDWLAVQFMRGPQPHSATSAFDSAKSVSRPWDVKALMKLIVMSATYQQASGLERVPTLNGSGPSLKTLDPENRWLARGARFRLPAEVVRDQALFAAGMLTERLGGPSFKPYQPDGLWAELATDTLYEQSHGPDLYRRSLYIYWKRTVPHPLMMNFDSTSREMCEVRQARTNTPLQALNLLNDVTFMEASRVLAANVHKAHATDVERIDSAFRKVLSRRPNPIEEAVLLKSLTRYRDEFRRHPDQARKLAEFGETPAPKSLPAEELAAWTAFCNTLLNLDEAVTKE